MVWIRWWRSRQLENSPEVVIISGHGTIESAVRATKLGAYDFLEKPLSLDRTLLVLKNATQARQMREDNREFVRQLSAYGTVTGQSVPMKALRQQIKLMAPTNGRVLIYGESGTGKELIGRAMHAESLRKDRVFVALNCAAIPEDYIETELFGYRHGAGRAQGSGRPAEKRGTFERADGGTLFLDEVGDMSLKTQAKVLRALDEQRFVPVGATHPVHVDVRVIAATNKDLEEEIARGNFREDLFYRLNVIPFFVPPLQGSQGGYSAAGEGVSAGVRAAVWAASGGDERGGAGGAAAVSLAGECAGAAESDRAGADSESEGAADRAQAAADAGVSRAGAGWGREGKPAGRGEEFATLLEAREAYERDFILKKLDECHGNVSRTAEALGLERSHLYRKMKALGVSVKE